MHPAAASDDPAVVAPRPAAMAPEAWLWRAVWVAWVYAGLLGSWSLGIGVLTTFALAGLSLVLGARWLRDGGRTIYRRRHGGHYVVADAGAGRGLRHPLALPLAMMAMMALVGTRALAIARVHLSEPGLLDVAACAGNDGWDAAGRDAERVGLMLLRSARIYRNSDGRPLGVEFATDDSAWGDSVSLFLADGDAGIEDGTRINDHEFGHLFGRWWTVRVHF